MAYIELSNPTKYKAHYNTTIKAVALTDVCAITIKQPSNGGGQIRVLYNGLAYTGSFGIPKGQTIEVFIDLVPGYTINSFTLNNKNIVNGYRTAVEEDIVISASTVIQQFVVQFYNDEHTKIKINCNGMDNFVNFNAMYNDTITVSADPTADGYYIKSLTLNGEEIENGFSIKVTKNIAVKAISAKKIINVSIDTIENGILSILYNGKTYINGSNIKVEYGDSINISIEPSTGYTVKDITSNNASISEGDYVITVDSVISAKIEKSIYSIHIVQPENASITVQENGITHRSDFETTYGTNLLILAESTNTEDYYIEKVLVNNKEIKNNSYYEVVSNTTITATVGEIIHIPEYSIRLNQSKYAIITATNGDNSYTSNFLAQEGSNINFVCNTTVTDYAEITMFSIDSTTYDITDTNTIKVELSNITANHTVSCSSRLKDILMNLSFVNCKLKVISINDVSQAINTNYNIHYQDKIVIEIEPYTGYELKSYTEIEGLTRDGNTFTFNSYSSGIEEFVINFICEDPRVYRIVKLDQENHASLTIQDYSPESDGSYRIPDDTKINIIVEPEEGYEVTGITKI